MAVAVVKKLRIGRRRSKAPESSPLELALAPAVRDGRWRVPDRFNFTRDVVEVLARDVKRRALTFVGADGIIEPRTFRELTEGATRWASILRSEEVGPGDRVLVLSGATVDWVELVLGCLKVGAIVVPSPPDLTAPLLESRFVATGASLVVAGDESKAEIARMSFVPDLHHLFEGRRRRSSDVVDEQPTEDTSARDIAFLMWTAGTSGPPKAVAHTHGAIFAARCPAEHWLGVGPGDVVWCTAPPESLQAVSTLFGAWAHGAEVAIHDGRFDPVERLELLHRFDVTVASQTPAEYRALAGRRELARYRSQRLRRLVSTGDYLDPEIVASFETAWGTTIRNGYGQAEANVVVAHGPENDAPADSLGRALPGHQVAILDDQGNELPPGIEGMLAVRERPPTLFAGYWDSPEETRNAFSGDWYVTGDLAVADEDGNFWFVARAEDTITSRGRTFGPHEVERVLAAHDVVKDSAVVGMPDLERGGHFLRAFVILEAGVEGSEQLEAELRHSLGQSLLEQQVPREIEFIDELPTASSGAVRRGELRERPVAGRPLWEVKEPEPEAVIEPVGERVVEPDLTALGPFLAEPVQAPVQAPSEPVFEAVLALPAEAPPAPAAREPAAPEPHPDPVAEVADPLPPPELPAEPPAPPAVEPVEPEPSSLPLEPVAESAPEPFVEPTPEPVETPEAAAPEAEVEPERAPEPIAEAAPPLEPVAEPEPISPVEAPEAVDVPAPTEAAHVPEFEPELEPEPPAPEPMPEPAPPDVAPEPEEDADEEPPLGSVIELVPPPEPPVDPTKEPLPDFVVPPGGVEERVPSPPPSPTPSALEEEEEDLGPLPEYIVDPSRRLEPVATVQPDPSPPASDPDAPQAPSFPSVPVLDLGGIAGTRRDSEGAPPSHASSRPRPASPPAAPKRRGSAAEPGDEAEETSWMKGLSSRLSAYSLEEEDQERVEPANEEAGGEPEEKPGD
jgi:acyl-coenzyme A synthetase/AMP-(fatty) acid ligase